MGCVFTISTRPFVVYSRPKRIVSENGKKEEQQMKDVNTSANTDQLAADLVKQQ